MYLAARRLADCWCSHIGPAPKKSWYDGHEELEQALVRLGTFVDSQEAAGKGRKYIDLARFLLDCRRNGEPYDQSHLPVTRQYEAVGHAVRASYLYSGMAGVAMETGDVDYQSAVLSIWENLVHKRYYVTGGIGSGETSEGFGPNYSLPNRAYCESCANCGELFFQHKMNEIYHQAQFADLYEDTYYNAILGDLDLGANNFTYTNALDSSEKRYSWHGCPCCVGNISRTLLMLPTWMYATGKDSLYVNLYAGSTVRVGNVAGTEVQIEQTTEYPWRGKVQIVLRGVAPKRFTIYLRVPARDASRLYTAQPAVEGLKSLSVNGSDETVKLDNGYAVLTREWKDGDRIELELPMAPQRVKADERRGGRSRAGGIALRAVDLLHREHRAGCRKGVARRRKPDCRVEGWPAGRRGRNPRQVCRRQPAYGHSLFRPRKSRRAIRSVDTRQVTSSPHKNSQCRHVSECRAQGGDAGSLALRPTGR